MGETMPGLAWVFGPGQEGGHSFTVSGEGQIAKQLLAEYWLSHAVQLQGWTFYGSRQSTPGFEDFVIQIGELGKVDAENFLVKTVVDEESQKLDIVAWHPMFADLPEEHHGQLLFLFLDEALGEFGVQSWIGNIDIDPVDADAVDDRNVHRLSNLPKFIDDIYRYHGWEKLSPLEEYTAYTVPEQFDAPRGDTIAGITCIPGLLSELLSNEGHLEEDPLDETGAALAYLEFQGSVFPDGDEANVRQNIEDAIADALEQDGDGKTLGGGTGTKSGYIDLLLFNGNRSRELVDDAMNKLELADRYVWHEFV